jgi:YVTN family beta-propeller protein
MHSLKRITLHSILVSTLIALSMAAMTLGARPAGAAPFAYVTNFNSDTVSVISMATNTVVATIPVGSNPSRCGHHPRWRIRLRDAIKLH